MNEGKSGSTSMAKDVFKDPSPSSGWMTVKIMAKTATSSLAW